MAEAVARDALEPAAASRADGAQLLIHAGEPADERERQVMRLVVAGRLNKQIAAELGISEMTAKIHRGQVFRKMQAASLPDLVRMADKPGITKIKA